MAKKLNEGIKGRLTEKFSHAAVASSGRVHVVPSKAGWSVKKEGSKRAGSVTATKETAIKVAKNIQSADRVIIHKKDGTIQKNTRKKK